MNPQRTVGYCPFGVGIGTYGAALSVEAPSRAQLDTEAKLAAARAALVTIAGAQQAAAIVAGDAIAAVDAPPSQAP